VKYGGIPRRFLADFGQNLAPFLTSIFAPVAIPDFLDLPLPDRLVFLLSDFQAEPRAAYVCTQVVCLFRGRLKNGAPVPTLGMSLVVADSLTSRKIVRIRSLAEIA
jgi:hypothetical protein